MLNSIFHAGTFSIEAVGLASGMGFITLAVLITMTAGIFILILEKLQFGNPVSRERTPNYHSGGSELYGRF